MSKLSAGKTRSDELDRQLQAYMKELGSDFEVAYEVGADLKAETPEGKAYDAALDRLDDKCPGAGVVPTTSKLAYSDCAVILEAVKSCESQRNCSESFLEKRFSDRERQHFQSISGTAGFTTEKLYAHCKETCQTHAYKVHPTREELCGY